MICIAKFATKFRTASKKITSNINLNLTSKIQDAPKAADKILFPGGKVKDMMNIFEISNNKEDLDRVSQAENPGLASVAMAGGLI